MTNEYEASPPFGISYECVECGYGVRPGEPHFEELLCEECYEINLKVNSQQYEETKK